MFRARVLKLCSLPHSKQDASQRQFVPYEPKKLHELNLNVPSIGHIDDLSPSDGYGSANGSGLLSHSHSTSTIVSLPRQHSNRSTNLPKHVGSSVSNSHFYSTSTNHSLSSSSSPTHSLRSNQMADSWAAAGNTNGWDNPVATPAAAAMVVLPPPPQVSLGSTATALLGGGSNRIRSSASANSLSSSSSTPQQWTSFDNRTSFPASNGNANTNTTTLSNVDLLGDLDPIDTSQYTVFSDLENNNCMNYGYSMPSTTKGIYPHPFCFLLRLPSSHPVVLALVAISVLL